MLKIRRSRDRLIFNVGIPYPEKTVSILRRGPGSLSWSHVTAKNLKILSPIFI